MIYGTFPWISYTAIYFLKLIPIKNTRRLKKKRRINALKISGDFFFKDRFWLSKALLLFARVRKDCIKPVTQKKVTRPAININASKRPISLLDIWLFVIAMLIIKKVVNLNNWYICRLPTLLKTFLRFNRALLRSLISEIMLN